MYGSGLRKYHPSIHSHDKNEPKKMSNRKKALMALTASGILLWKSGDKIKQLFRYLTDQDIARADQGLQQGEDEPDIADYVPLAPSGIHDEDDERYALDFILPDPAGIYDYED